MVSGCLGVSTACNWTVEIDQNDEGLNVIVRYSCMWLQFWVPELDLLEELAAFLSAPSGPEFREFQPIGMHDAQLRIGVEEGRVQFKVYWPMHRERPDLMVLELPEDESRIPLVTALRGAVADANS